MIELDRTKEVARVAMIPEKVTPTPTPSPAKCGSELTPVTLTPLKSRNLPYIVDSFWEKSRLRLPESLQP